MWEDFKYWLEEIFEWCAIIWFFLSPVLIILGAIFGWGSNA